MCSCTCTTDKTEPIDKLGNKGPVEVIPLLDSNVSRTDKHINPDSPEECPESFLLVNPDDLINSLFSKANANTPSNLNALCELWDFEGQKEFYATHQAFLSSCAVYLVVADMEDDIDKPGSSRCFADFQHIGGMSSYQ